MSPMSVAERKAYLLAEIAKLDDREAAEGAAADLAESAAFVSNEGGLKEDTPMGDATIAGKIHCY